MTTEELILNAIEHCLLECEDPEQKRIFHWMKATLLYPNIQDFCFKIQTAGLGGGKVSQSSLDKAIEAVYSYREYQADLLDAPEEKKHEMLQLEKIRLDAVKTTIRETLRYLGWLE